MRLSDDVGLLLIPLDSLLENIGLTGEVTGEKGDFDESPLPNALLPSTSSINESLIQSTDELINKSTD